MSWKCMSGWHDKYFNENDYYVYSSFSTLFVPSQKNHSCIILTWKILMNVSKYICKSMSARMYVYANKFFIYVKCDGHERFIHK